MRKAWKYYLTRVLPHAVRSVRNFLFATMAEGRNIDRGDTALDAAAKMPAITCDLKVNDIIALLSEDRKDSEANTLQDSANQVEEITIHPRVQEAVRVVNKLLANDMGTRASDASAQRHAAFTLHRCLEEAHDGTNTASPLQNIRLATFDLYRHDWTLAYEEWCAHLEASDKSPYGRQWEILNAVHEQCLREWTNEHSRQSASVNVPFFKLVHGLPGSGKSEVLKWLTSYFEKIWHWQQGVHFEKVAFMNSMAANIGGVTIHSWGEIGYLDKSGTYCKPRQSDDRDVPSMNAKCASLRWLLVDEVEAAGSELLEQLSDSLCQHVPESSKYKRRTENVQGYSSIRPFGGVNTLLVGDFWQIPPVGQVAIMGNPFGKAALENATASSGLAKFWSKPTLNNQDSLQAWGATSSRVLELHTNKRSGGDQWYSEVLNACRLGRLSDMDYSFLHGYPTNACGSWLESEKRPLCGNVACTHFGPRLTASLPTRRDDWKTEWELFQWRNECDACRAERNRRHRVLDSTAQINNATVPNIYMHLQEPKFAEAVYITGYNHSAALYGLRRARMFARAKGVQLIWIQAEDRPPVAYFGEKSKKEMEDIKKK